jgi:hypothetical protein
MIPCPIYKRAHETLLHEIVRIDLTAIYGASL